VPAGRPQVRSGVASWPSSAAARRLPTTPARAAAVHRLRDIAPSSGPCVPGRWLDAVSDIFANWVAVGFATIIGIILVATALIANILIAPKAPSRAKGTPFECGMLPIGRTSGQVHFRYYVFAILFLIFDVEAVFLFPWAVTFLDVGQTAFWEMVLFIFILAAGLGYAWKKGVLTWR
jgi:NADH:ubiquinone oxidoreductase subunit 3 (subunit A)